MIPMSPRVCLARSAQRRGAHDCRLDWHLRHGICSQNGQEAGNDYRERQKEAYPEPAPPVFEKNVSFRIDAHVSGSFRVIVGRSAARAFHVVKKGRPRFSASPGEE